MCARKRVPNDTSRFVEWLREGIPTLIAQHTEGQVVQTAHRDLLPRMATGDAAFAVYLSDGAAYRIRVQQIGEGEIEEIGCQQCGELLPAHELDEQGSCRGCAQERWDALSADEQAEWCRVNKQHYPFQAKGPMSAEQLEWITQLLESHPYRFTKTMPKNPHWYTLRHEWADVGEQVFERVVRMIREHGVTRYFGTYPWRHLEVGGFTYWSYFSSSVPSVIVLNRKPLPGQATQEEDT